MKKVFFLLIAANGALSAIAQSSGTTPPTPGVQPAYKDCYTSHWALDVNLRGGLLNQNFTTVNTASNYPNATKADISDVTFSKGMSYGIDAQVGYFFGKNAHFGIGTGFMYMMQFGEAKVANYSVDYRGTDAHGDFRQMIESENLREKLTITNLNVPLMLKYRTRFSDKWGFTADAGILFNVMMKNNYNSKATFDYEATVLHVTDASGNIHTVYDNGTTPNSADLVITAEHFLQTNPGKNVNDYFAMQRSLGYNVGLNVAPNNTRGSVSYNGGSVGFMAQPALSYYINDKTTLNFGLYYQYQSFNRSAGNGVAITGKVGDYNSVLNNVSSVSTHSYGVNVGLRFNFGKPKDSDKDGVPDKEDKCPDVFGLAKLHGCPDADNDGVPDAEDHCPDVFGLVQFHGCPDSDGDGIPDEKDACPFVPGPVRFNGCPDSDNDGVPDSEDRCPSAPGPASNYGCPVAEAPKPKAAEERKHEHDMSEPILFDLGKTTIKDQSIPILLEAVMELNDNENAFIVIDGHTDAIGGDRINDPLSYRRANAVKKYLVDMGSNPKMMVVVGHGSRQPIAPNTTAEGRAMNRRVIMSLKHRPKEQ
jgi:outer membrane protein OmpA-like peptidoglycan-associated protein